MTEPQHPAVFVLLARGPAGDPEVIRRGWEEWHERVASENAAWLGSTGGISPGGEWLAASASARRRRRRPRPTRADRHRFEATEVAAGNRFATRRRDFLAGLRAWTAPDRVTVVDWFTSEADARAGETIEIPADLGALFGQ